MKGFFIAIFFLGTITVSAQSIDELRSNKKELQQKIILTNSLIHKNRQTKTSSIHQLEVVKTKIALEQEVVDNLNLEIQLLDKEVKRINAEIEEMKVEIEGIKKEYAALVYTSWKMSKAGKQFHYILAGYDLGMVYRRFRYIISFNQFRHKQVQELQAKQALLENKRKESIESEQQKSATMLLKNQQILALSSSKKQKEILIKSLQREESGLRTQLKNQQHKINELDAFIQNIIRKEMEAAAKRKNSGEAVSSEQKLIGNSFIANKGRLPWPLSQGVVVQRFGNYRPEGLSRVSLKTNGVDYAAQKGTEARAVFNGVVVGVYALPGYNSGVIVKHGAYFTFYANLEQVYVKQGESIHTKEALGKVFYDDSEGKCVLHFELYKDKTALNPGEWLAK